jgi:hypothetical protein
MQARGQALAPQYMFTLTLYKEAAHIEEEIDLWFYLK